jgi:dephospho-CoA kinase/inosine/xanthosine triphosphate pyrophosphatase family protein
MIEIVFISSSRIKFAHIDYLLDGSKYYITPQRNYGIGYVEPRIYNRDELLKISYVDARKRFEKSVGNAQNKFFILEDTSVVIDALSDESNEVPGLDIKYWMQEHDFKKVDSMLKERGNNRKCTVRSDILLHLPGDLQQKYKCEYMIFTGTQKGYICRQEVAFETNPLYPWLDNKTFNKWFVPEGLEREDICISRLDIENALKYDFRAKAVNKLIKFLDSQELGTYEKKLYKRYSPTLFDAKTFLLLGSTCAGKSTLAQYLYEKYGYYHIEASDFMYLEYYKRHGVDSDVRIGDFAQKALEDNPIIVAKQVVEFCRKIKSAPIVVSGFRAIEEVEYFQKYYQDSIAIYIDTKQTLRFERCKKRNRKDVAISFDAFKEKDRQQFEMGIDTLKNNIKDTIENNDSYEEYYKSFDKKFGSLAKGEYDKASREIKNLRLEELILLALSDHEGEYFTTTQIAKLINKKFPGITKHKDNVSRYFNQSFHPYYEIVMRDGKKVYSLSATGLSQARYLIWQRR